MADAIKLQTAVLGLQPFVLLTVIGVDDDGTPQLDMRWGGGIEEEVIPDFLEMCAQALNTEVPDARD